MQTRIGFLTGMAVGYVFGTRAGRTRYEQIKQQADALWNDPRVQDKVSTATETVKAKAPEVQARLTSTIQEKAPVIGQKVADTASSAASTASSKASSAASTASAKAADLKDSAAAKASDVKDAARTDHTGNQIGVEKGSDVDPKDVKFESAD